MKVKAEPVMSQELYPGDLFSTYGPGYWSKRQKVLAIGESVYIRTDAPTPVDQLNVPVFRITIER